MLAGWHDGGTSNMMRNENREVNIGCVDEPVRWIEAKRKSTKEN